jgi:uncharacterized membrane protein YhaH (DUF805 family)
MPMLGAIKYNLSNLANFKGRDARQTFWFYVLFLVLVQYAIGLLISLPMMGEGMSTAFKAAKSGVPAEQMQQQMMAGMAGMMRTSMLASAGVSVLSALLLVAAFVRRLHDSGRPGWIAAIPFLLVLGALGYSMAHLEPMLEAMAHIDAAKPTAMLEAQRPMLVASALSWVGYLVVIVFGAWPSTDGPNAYGEDSIQF